MSGRSKYLFKNVGILTISNFASKILVFLLVPLYTSVLSEEDVGVYDLIVSTVSLLFPILTVNIIDGVMRFSMDKTKSKNEIIIIAIRYIIISWIIGAISIFVIKQFRLLPQIDGLEVLIFLYFVFYILYHLLLQFAKGLEYVTDMGIAGVIATIVMLGGNILFLLIFRMGLKGFIFAYTAAQFFPTIYLFFRIGFWKYLTVFRINKTLQKEMLIYSIPLIATTLGWWVNSTSDKYVVAIMIGIGANGLLSVSYKIPQIINTLQGIFIQAWQISAVKEYGESDTAKFYGQAFSFVNTLMCITCSGLIILTKPLGHILYKNGFYEAWRYVPFLLLACVINSVSGFLGPILSAKKDSKSMAVSSIYGALANIVLNVIFVFVVGIQGATIATVIASLIIYFVRKRAVGNEIIIENYSLGVITWIILCIEAVIEIYTMYWWIEIILIVFIFILNGNKLKKIILKALNLIIKYRKEEK